MPEFAPYIYADVTSSQDFPIGEDPSRRIQKERRCLNFAKCKSEAMEIGGFCSDCFLDGGMENYLWEQSQK